MYTLVCTLDDDIDVYDVHPANEKPVYVATLDLNDVVYSMGHEYTISPAVPEQLRNVWDNFVQYLFDYYIIDAIAPNVPVLYDPETDDVVPFVQAVSRCADIFAPVADVI